MTTWLDPKSIGALTLVDKLNSKSKRPAHRIGRREAGADGNPVAASEWHAHESKFETKTAALELHLPDALTVVAEADRENIEYATEHRAALFAAGTDELDVQSYYKPLSTEGKVLRVKVHKGDTKVFSMVGGGAATKVPMAELRRDCPVCVEVIDHGLWFNTEDQSWGPRWVVRNVYITGDAAPAIDDDEFADAL